MFSIRQFYVSVTRRSCEHKKSWAFPARCKDADQLRVCLPEWECWGREIEAETRFSRDPVRERPVPVERRTISKQQELQESDLTVWKNAVEEGEILSNIPIFLSKKREFLQQSQAGV